jgi:prepilin-type processing-associated H-X9-DG protein
MKKTSKTPLVLDSLATDGRMYGIIWSALGGYIGMMHNNSSNVCFADGHAGVLDIVGWSDHEALQNHYVYPSQTWDMPKVLYRTDYSTPVPLP